MLAKVKIEFFVSFPNSEPDQAIAERERAKMLDMSHEERMAYLEFWRVKDPCFVPTIVIIKDPPL